MSNRKDRPNRPSKLVEAIIRASVWSDEDFRELIADLRKKYRVKSLENGRITAASRIKADRFAQETAWLYFKDAWHPILNGCIKAVRWVFRVWPWVN